MRRPRCTALKERDIKELLSSTRSVFRTDSFCIKIAKKKDCSFLTKLLISIPKKIGNAPQRNYIRRSIKEVFYGLALCYSDFNYAIFFKKKDELFCYTYFLKVLQEISLK